MANKIAALYTNDSFIYKVNICLFLKFYQSMLYLNQNFFDYRKFCNRFLAKIVIIFYNIVMKNIHLKEVLF